MVGKHPSLHKTLKLVTFWSCFSFKIRAFCNKAEKLFQGSWKRPVFRVFSNLDFWSFKWLSLPHLEALDSGEATVGSSTLPSKCPILSCVEKLSLPVSSVLLHGYPISEERIRLQHQALVCPPKMCYCVAASKCCTRKVNWERCHKKLENALFSRHLNFFHVLYVYD